VFEARERLVGEAHDEQADPAEDLGVAVGVDFVNADGGERAGQGNPQQQIGAPQRPQRQRDGDAGLEETAIQRVGQRRLFFQQRQRLRRGGRGLRRLGPQLIERVGQRNLVSAGEELQRFGRPLRPAAPAQAIAIQHRTNLRRSPQKIGNLHVGIDPVNRTNHRTPRT